MKVARWYSNQDIRLEERPRPQPGVGEMLVKVISCGICGSDIVEWYRQPRAPLVPGHEIGGEVVEVGEGVDQYQPGDRVFVAPKVPCMTCVYCQRGNYPVCSSVKDRLPGGFAEYVLVPEALLKQGTYLLSDGIGYDQSTFIEPLACVVRAQNLAALEKNQRVLVMGCGMSGLLHVKLAKSKNCWVSATDISRERRSFAQKFGADTAIDAALNVPEILMEHGRQADVVILCTSAMMAVEQAWKCVDKGGRIVFFAVPGPDKAVTIPINDFWMKEISIMTSYYCGPSDIREAMDLIRQQLIDVEHMITHRLPLSDIGKGFELVIKGKESIKVIIKPHSSVSGRG